MSTTNRKPKVILFDVGGVLVKSPFQAIIDYETKHDIPQGYMNYCIREGAPNGSWQKLERGEIPCDENFFRPFKAELENPEMWEKFHRQLREKAGEKGNSTTPSIPPIDAETLFWTMMTNARTPDPYIAPALAILSSKHSSQFILAGLSNTSIFPKTHPLYRPSPTDPRRHLSPFISSAHVGMRKPEPRIYAYAMEKLIEAYPEKDIRPEDVVFLDDIGENLKQGRAMGWRTIRVVLGRTEDAVRELEEVTGVRLLGVWDGEREGKARL